MLETPQTSEVSLGQTLAQARQQQGKTCEQVAKELNIQLDKLRALEDDEYDKLFSPVFVRGYIRSYAKMFNLDSAPLIARYDLEHQGEDQPLPVSDSLNVKIKTGAPKWPSRLLLIIFIVVLWGLAYWYFGERHNGDVAAAVTEAPAELATPAQPLPTSVSHTVQDAAIEPLEVTPGGSAVANQAGAAEISDTEDNEVTELATAAAATQLGSGELEPSADSTPFQDTLVMRFAADCWVNITDAGGEVLLADLQTAGSSLTLTGVSPFDITLGNAEGVEVELNNEPIAIPLPGSDKVVHFTAARSQQ